MAKIRSALAANSLAAAPSVLMGHPGHGAGGGSHGLIHYFTEPVHLVASLGIITVIASAFVALRWRRDRIRRSLRAL